MADACDAVSIGVGFGRSQSSVVPMERPHPWTRLRGDCNRRQVGVQLVEEVPEPAARSERPSLVTSQFAQCDVVVSRRNVAKFLFMFRGYLSISRFSFFTQ
jgi:hypothetical protein